MSYFAERQDLCAHSRSMAIGVERAIIKDLKNLLQWDIPEIRRREDLIIAAISIYPIVHSYACGRYYEETGHSLFIEQLVLFLRGEIDDALASRPEFLLTPINNSPLNRQDELIIELANGCEIRSGWIDRDDPDALTAGDYLSVLNASGEQLFYLDAADLFSDSTAGRGKLLEFLQTCVNG